MRSMIYSCGKMKPNTNTRFRWLTSVWCPFRQQDKRGFGVSPVDSTPATGDLQFKFLCALKVEDCLMDTKGLNVLVSSNKNEGNQKANAYLQHTSRLLLIAISS